MGRRCIRLVAGAAIAAAALAPGVARANCVVRYDTTAVVPPNGARNVPVDTIITTAANVAPKLVRTDTGALVEVTRSPLPGVQQAYGWKPWDPTAKMVLALPPDTDLTVDDGRSFHTLPDGSSGPPRTRWEVEKSGYPGEGGCNSDECAPFEIVLRAVKPGEEPGWFHLYADKAGRPASDPAVAFLKEIADGPGTGERTVTIWGSEQVSEGDTLRLVPVDLAGVEGTPLSPVKFAGSGGGGCATASGRRRVSLVPWFFLLMITLEIRGRTRSR